MTDNPPAGSAQDAWFRVFFEAGLDGMILHDKGTILVANAAFATLFRAEAASFGGRSVFDFIAPQDKGRLEQRIASGSSGTHELEAMRDDGSRFPVLVKAQNVAGAHGVRMVIVRDLSQQEAGLEEVRKEILEREEVRRLQETNRFKTQILNTTAHELNTPLTPVRLQLHLLKSGAFGVLDKRQEKAITILDRNVERLSFLVNDILDVARLESGRLELSQAPMRLGDILLEAMESFEETARRLGVALGLEGPTDLSVDADHDRLMQVLYNLIGNALKFTPEGGRVDLRTAIADDDVVISITDTGPGLDEDQIKQLFQPFSRVHDTAHSTVPGTGLGLFICKGIVDAHGGSIWAESDGPGKGARFNVRLAVVEVRSDEIVSRPARKPKPIDALAQRLRELI